MDARMVGQGNVLRIKRGPERAQVAASFTAMTRRATKAQALNDCAVYKGPDIQRLPHTYPGHGNKSQTQVMWRTVTTSPESATSHPVAQKQRVRKFSTYPHRHIAMPLLGRLFKIDSTWQSKIFRRASSRGCRELEYMSIVAHRVAPVSSRRGMFVKKKRRTSDPVSFGRFLPDPMTCTRRCHHR